MSYAQCLNLEVIQVGAHSSLTVDVGVDLGSTNYT
jgi:hypothetical protein